EMMENPILEEVMETQGDSPNEPGEKKEASDLDPEGEQKRDEEAFQKPESKEEQLIAGKDDFNWESYVEEFNSTSSSAPSMREINDELASFEHVLTKTTSLEDHLNWQISMASLTEDETKFARLVVGNLSDDGYLNAKV